MNIFQLFLIMTVLTGFVVSPVKSMISLSDKESHSNTEVNQEDQRLVPLKDMSYEKMKAYLSFDQKKNDLTNEDLDQARNQVLSRKKTFREKVSSYQYFFIWTSKERAQHDLIQEFYEFSDAIDTIIKEKQKMRVKFSDSFFQEAKNIFSFYKEKEKDREEKNSQDIADNQDEKLSSLAKKRKNNFDDESKDGTALSELLVKRQCIQNTSEVIDLTTEDSEAEPEGS